MCLYLLTPAAHAPLCVCTCSRLNLMPLCVSVLAHACSSCPSVCLYLLTPEPHAPLCVCTCSRLQLMPLCVSVLAHACSSCLYTAFQKYRRVISKNRNRKRIEVDLAPGWLVLEGVFHSRISSTNYSNGLSKNAETDNS